MKRFDLQDQRKFAHLSGDFNPLHLDPIYCRRLLFGEPVVHGIHILLWSLEQLLDSFPSSVALKELKATFRNPLPLDTPIRIETIQSGAHGFEIQSGGNHCEVAGQFHEKEDTKSSSLALPSEAPGSECKELSFQKAAEAEGCVSLFLNQAELRSMFPRVAGRLPAVQVAQILATTRFTGMECPGLHSLYHSLELQFAENSGPAELRYHVCHSDERFSVLQFGIRSFGLEGKVATFFRPPPTRQPSFSEVAREVHSGEFRHQRALVVGGSRGLGELTAKIVAAGGGAIRFTYHRGRQDAERVSREISEKGVDCGYFPLDVTQGVSAALEEGVGGWGPTHLYYFATPHVSRSESQASFSPQRFLHFCKYYVEGFSSVLEALSLSGDSSPIVFYPSSVLVDTLEEGMGEYGAAKVAGEALCRFLQRRSRLKKFHAPRLPRLQTDQTASIRPRKTENSLEVMLKEIRKLESV